MIGEIRKIKTSDNPCSLIQQFQKDEKILTKENHINYYLIDNELKIIIIYFHND